MGDRKSWGKFQHQHLTCTLMCLNHILIIMKQQTYARVARICKNDKGGRHVLLNRWTTFIKARLICDKSGKESNIFNNLTSVSEIVPISATPDDIDYFVFATFTSPWWVFLQQVKMIFVKFCAKASYNMFKLYEAYMIKLQLFMKYLLYLLSMMNRIMSNYEPTNDEI